MKMTSDEEKLGPGTSMLVLTAIEYFHKTMSDNRRIELDLLNVRKRRSATMDTEAG